MPVKDVPYLFQYQVEKSAPFAVYYLYFAFVLLEFVCQLYPDTKALENWKYDPFQTKESLFHESHEKEREKEPLLENKQCRAEFLNDEVKPFCFNKSQRNFLLAGT